MSTTPLSLSLDLTTRATSYLQQKSAASSNRTALQNQIRELHPQALTSLIKRLIDAQITELRSPAQIEKLVELIDLKDIEKTLSPQGDFREGQQAMREAQRLYETAKTFVEENRKSLPLGLRQHLVQALETLIHVLESFLSAFGVADFFQPSENEFHASYKGQKILVLLTLFSTVTAILVPVIGASLAGQLIGGSLLAIAGISLIYPHIRPAPSKLPLGENWTKQVKEGLLTVSQGRGAILNQMAETLLGNHRGAKMYPMLIGKTGVGKTETAKAFAAAVERGDYPDLQGKQVIYFNCADLVNNKDSFSSGNKSLENILREIGPHQEKYILVLDEIHLLCQKREEAMLSDQLKTILDDEKGRLPYLIGITTEEDFARDIHGAHFAFARRFREILVENTTDADTFSILVRALFKWAPDAVVEREAFDTLIQEAQNLGEGAMPANALRLLSLCMQKMEGPVQSLLSEEIERVKEEIHFLSLRGGMERTAGDSLPECQRRLQEL